MGMTYNTLYNIPHADYPKFNFKINWNSETGYRLVVSKQTSTQEANTKGVLDPIQGKCIPSNIWQYPLQPHHCHGRTRQCISIPIPKWKPRRQRKRRWQCPLFTNSLSHMHSSRRECRLPFELWEKSQEQGQKWVKMPDNRLVLVY